MICYRRFDLVDPKRFMLNSDPVLGLYLLPELSGLGDSPLKFKAGSLAFIDLPAYLGFNTTSLDLYLLFQPISDDTDPYILYPSVEDPELPIVPDLETGDLGPEP